MRPIEFRCWDSQLKNWLSARETYEQLENQARWNPEVGERFHLMQFTGLLDRDGKKIFEGDIVKASIYFDEPPQILEVYFDQEGSFVIDFHDSEADLSSIGWFISNAGSIEVIGNIYENPELLEK